MRLIFTCTMILTTALAAGCGSEVSTGGTGSGGAGGNGATSSASSSASGTGGSAASKDACNSCIELADPFKAGTVCGEKVAVCKKDGPCASWLGCTDECFHNDWTAECFTACDVASVDSKSLYEPIYPCACAPCAAECGFLCD